MVLLSQKEYEDNSLASQKKPGWVFYMSDGTWAWNMGSGRRRITYERENGEHMPLNDGRWHQLTMTYDSALSEVRLFYDGDQQGRSTTWQDSTGFDFTTRPNRSFVGWAGNPARVAQQEILPAIYAGAKKLQQLVDARSTLWGWARSRSAELVNLIVEPRQFVRCEKVSSNERAALRRRRSPAFIQSMRDGRLRARSQRIESELMRNPYTIHQAFSFMEAAPLLKIFSLVDGEGDSSTTDVSCGCLPSGSGCIRPSFDIDNLDDLGPARCRPEEVLDSYSAHVSSPRVSSSAARGSSPRSRRAPGTSFTAASTSPWMSTAGTRDVAIAQILAREDVDVVMMQETYSSGDFIAAELGYYFATTDRSGLPEPGLEYLRAQPVPDPGAARPGGTQRS